MGLDMYLYLRKSEYRSGGHWSKEEERKLAKYPKELESFEKEIEERNFPSVSVDTDYQIGYWRKANAIHNWIVEHCADGVDNCRDVYVSKAKLKELLNACNEVLANREVAKNKLPTQAGFFFGSLDYDDWYFEDLEYTKDLLTKVLDFLNANEDKGYQIVYCASW